LHQTGNTTLDGASYTYDNAGNQVSKVNYNGITSSYSHDALRELTQVAACVLALPLTAVAQSNDNMKPDQSQQDQMKHDDLSQDQSKKDDMKKDEMKKDKKAKKG
jgi:pentapeptide MXKDX repeat protein